MYIFSLLKNWAQMIDIWDFNSNWISHYLKTQVKYFWYFWYLTPLRSTDLCKENCIDDHHCTHPEICLKKECQVGCVDNYHCKNGEECYQHTCHKTCKTDKNCPFGQYCFIDEKICRPKCVSNDECGYGFVCQGGNCFRSCETSICPDEGTYCHTWELCDKHLPQWWVEFDDELSWLIQSFLSYVQVIATFFSKFLLFPFSLKVSSVWQHWIC